MRKNEMELETFEANKQKSEKRIQNYLEALKQKEDEGNGKK